MRKVVNLYKPISLTPLQAVEAYRGEHPEYAGEKLGYAGRLDPMAEGVLLVLVGEENKRRTFYERLGKTYVFEALFGAGTDTYDVMGRIGEVKPGLVRKGELEGALEEFVGEWEQEYPAYSSARVCGKPLYWWARQGRITEVRIPSKKVRVEEAELLEERVSAGAEIFEEVRGRILKTKGEFRQREILCDWEEFGRKFGEVEFSIVKVRVECSHGVYVRGLANMLGEKMKIPCLAYSILRTRVGEYDLSSSAALGSIGE